MKLKQLSIRQFVLTLLIGMPTFSIAQQVVLPQQLSELIQLALQEDYDLENQALDIQATGLQRQEVLQKYLPTLDASGGYFYNQTNFNVDANSQTLTALGLPPFENKKFDANGALGLVGVNAKMTLFSGLKIPYLAKALEQKKLSQQVLMGKKQQEIIADVISSYDKLAILKQSELLLQESNVRLVAERKFAEGALKNGLAIPYDLKKIEIALLTLESKQTELDGKRELLLQKLFQLTHKDIGALSQLEVALTPIILSVGDLSIADRPELSALDYAYKAQQFKLKSERYWWLPKVQAQASYHFANASNLNLNTPFYNPIIKENMSFHADNLQVSAAWIVGVGFKWDLFDGLAGSHAVKQAKIELQKTENTKKHVEEMLVLNLQNMQTEYETANKNLKLKAKQKEYAENTLDLAVKSYNQGLISITERLQEESAYEQTTLDYIQALYHQREAAINLLMATGKLNTILK